MAPSVTTATAVARCDVRIDPDVIRRKCATVEGCREIDCSARKQVVSFLVTKTPGHHPETSERTTTTVAPRSRGRVRLPRRVRGRKTPRTSDHHHHHNDDDNVDDERPTTTPTTTPVHDDDLTSSDRIARVNVYYATGTVGVCHVLRYGDGNSEVRERFHHQCSVVQVMRLVRNPPSLVRIDGRLLSRSDDNDDDHRHQHNDHNHKDADTTTTASTSTTNTMTVADARRISPRRQQRRDDNDRRRRSVVPLASAVKGLRDRIELREIGAAILEGESQTLRDRLDKLSPPERRHEGSVPTTFFASGSSDHHDHDVDDHHQHNHNNNVDHPSPCHHVDNARFAFDLPRLDDPRALHEALNAGDVVSVATNGTSTVVLYGEGGPIAPNHDEENHHDDGHDQHPHHLVHVPPRKPYATNLSTALHRRIFDAPSRPVYVALGTMNRHYVAYADGTETWRGPRALGRALRNGGADRSPVASLSFGRTYQTFVVVYRDGTWDLGGDLPARLRRDVLSSRRASNDVGATTTRLECVSLGPNDEWFARSGRRRGRDVETSSTTTTSTLTGSAIWWGGVGDGLSRCLSAIDTRIRYVDFGADRSYVVQYL